jgi:hypothetical protein
MHFINKSSFILLWETTDSLRIFCVIVSIYTYIGAGLIDEEYNLRGFKDKDT